MLCINDKDSQANAEDEVDVCSLRVVNPGPKRCKINTQRRWTYSAKTKACEIFEYIPCTSKDPPNLFFNEYACLASCNQQGKTIIIQTVKQLTLTTIYIYRITEINQ